MKRMLKRVQGLFLLLVLLGSNSYVTAAEEVVGNAAICHIHSGDSVTGGGCYSIPNYHTHTGNTISGGTCYKTPVYHTHQGDSTGGGACYMEVECGGTVITPYGTHYIHECTICGFSGVFGEGPDKGATVGAICRDVTCPNIKYVLKCGQTEGASIEAYSLSCTKTIDSYSLGCGKSTDTVVGNLQLRKNKGVAYSLSINANTVDIQSYRWNTGENSQSIYVKANQEYSCMVSYNLDGRTSTAVLRYTVTDFDAEGPRTELICEDNIWSQNKTIKVTATDDGVGLHSQAYRINSGEWVSSDTFEIKANGTYTIEVRDALGNITTKTISVEHIDAMSPETTIVCDDSVWSQKKTIKVNATDNGVGLHNQAYRFNGGEWTSTNMFEISNNGTYTVEVRDALGNFTTKRFDVTHIDTLSPEITVNCDDSIWSLKKAITIGATDKGVGLHSQAYRFNGGKWGSEKNFEIASNGTYTIEVRDALGNITTKKVSVTRVDTLAPEVTVHCDDSIWSLKKKITITAADEGAGLHSKAFRINGGQWGSEKTFEVNTNGTYTIEVRDALGNIDTKKVNVSRIDTEAPNVEISCNDSIWSKKNTIIVSATDKGSGLHNEAYRINGGQWGKAKKFEVGENGTYTIEVRDALGNTTTKTSGVTKIDTVEPEVTINCDVSTWSQKKTITVKATDAGSGLHSQPYRINGGTWGSNNTFEVNENGLYTVEARDAEGNIAKKDIEIKYIDNKKPNVSASILSEKEWSNNKTIVVAAADTNSGMNRIEYSYGDSKWFRGGNQLCVEQNGKVFYRAYDNVGNVTSGVLEIKNIDCTAPKVSINTSEANNGVISVQAYDKEAGLHKMAYAYSKDGKEWSDWMNNNVYQMEDEGYVYVKVRDKVGNVSGEDFGHKQYIKPEKTEVQDENTLTVESKEVELVPAASESEDKEWMTSIKNTQENTDKGNAENNDTKTTQIAVVGILFAGVFTLSLAFLFFGFGNVKVYSVDEQGKRFFMCRAVLSKQGKMTIPEYRIHKKETDKLLVKPNAGILKKQNGKMITIYIGGNVFTGVIQKDILITY